MPALGFTTLKEAILTGKKVITVRKRAKDGRWASLQINDPLYLYWKLRTKACEKLFPDARPCIFKGGPITIEQFTESLATCDGFANLAQMRQWFSKTHKNHMTNGSGEFFIIGWQHPDPTVVHHFPLLPSEKICKFTYEEEEE